MESEHLQAHIGAKGFCMECCAGPHLMLACLVPSGKQPHNYGKSISNSYVSLPEGITLAPFAFLIPKVFNTYLSTWDLQVGAGGIFLD